MSTLIDSYSEANADTNQILDNVTPFYYTAKGQSFTSGIVATLDNVEFYVKKVGSPTGNAYAKIYAHSGTYGSNSKGTGTALAISDAVAASTISTSFSLVPFVFSGGERITLVADYYVVVLSYTSGDASNYLSLSSDNSSPEHSGNYAFLSDGSWGSGTVDMAGFYVYGTPIPSTVQGISTLTGVSSITL